MTYAAIALPWALLLAVVWALLAGQPAATASMVSTETANATVIASLKATNYAVLYPTATPHSPR